MITPISELVARLRAESFQLTDEAAAALEQQAARIVELEASHKIASAQADYHAARSNEKHDELVVANGRIAELEAARAQDADGLSLRALYEAACIAANKNAKDAERWRAGTKMHKFPEYGTGDKGTWVWYIADVDDEFDTPEAAIDAAIALSQSTGE